MVVGMDEEEKGYVGCKEFVPWLGDEEYNVQSVHNFDMIGYEGNDDGKVMMGQPSTELKELYERIIEENALDLFVWRNWLGSSDHVPFKLAGYNATLVAEDWTFDSSPVYHTSDDTIDYIIWDYMEKFTQMVFFVAADLTLVPNP